MCVINDSSWEDFSNMVLYNFWYQEYNSTIMWSVGRDQGEWFLVVRNEITCMNIQ
jgi:hypothetical protein